MSGFNENIEVQRSQQYFLAGTQDPSAVATAGAKGTIYLRVGVAGGQTYQKQDDGITTNWALNGSFSGSVVQENGATIGTNVGVLNFIGATVTPNGLGAVDITISAGGLTGVNNVGAGSGVFRDITGNDINLRSIIGTGLASVTQNANDITIDVQAFDTVNNVGGGVNLSENITATSFDLRTLVAGTNISITQLAGAITISSLPPTGTNNTVAYFSSVGALTSEAAFGYLATFDTLHLGVAPTIAAAARSLMIGETLSVATNSTNSILLGTSLSVGNVGNSLVNGLTIAFTGSVTHSIVVGTSISLGSSPVTTSIISGQSHSSPGGTTITASIISGINNMSGIGSFNSSLVVGEGMATPSIIRRSIVTGNGGVFNGQINDSIISAIGTVNGIYNNCIVVANSIAGGGTHDGSAIFGSNHSIANTQRCLVAGSNNNMTAGGPTASVALGLNLSVDGSQQTVLGRFNNPVTNARFIVGNGAGAGSEANALVIRQQGMMERTQAGLAVKTRIDASDPLNVTNETDYVVISTTLAANVVLPGSPRQGQELKIKSVLGGTVDGNGHNIDGSPTLVLAAGEGVTLVYEADTLAEWFAF
jgi:hypothetical protein